jgi:hypothetical protein
MKSSVEQQKRSNMSETQPVVPEASSAAGETSVLIISAIDYSLFWFA